MMKIKNYVLPLLFSISSSPIFAAPATDEQVETLIKIEHWNQVKPALAANGLPQFKSIMETALIDQMGLPQPISAHDQVTIMQVTDIVVNDLIDQIDEQELMKNVKVMYKQLSQEQADALIQLYQKPSMKEAGKKLPQTLATTIDVSANDFNQLVQSEKVQQFIKETQ